MAKPNYQPAIQVSKLLITSTKHTIYWGGRLQALKAKANVQPKEYFGLVCY